MFTDGLYCYSRSDEDEKSERSSYTDACFSNPANMFCGWDPKISYWLGFRGPFSKVIWF